MDDEPGVLEEIENDLIFEKFSLFKANSGEAALKIMEAEEISVALCDQVMPNGMSGVQFLSQARQKQPYLLGIILSAFGDSEYLMGAINEAKVFNYILKPWSQEELIARLTQALQFYHANLLDKMSNNDEELRYTKNLYEQAVLELNQTKKNYRELNRTISAISDVTTQISCTMRQDFN